MAVHLGKVSGHIIALPCFSQEMFINPLSPRSINAENQERIVLSALGMQRVCEHDRESFNFVIGKREFECSRSQACFISPRVSEMLHGDCTAGELCLDIEVDIDDDAYVECFEEVLCLGCGGCLHLNGSNSDYVRSISVLGTRSYIVKLFHGK